MAYVRKTRDEYNVQMLTCWGWEDVDCYNTYSEARESRKVYQENQPGVYRVKKKRVKINP